MQKPSFRCGPEIVLIHVPTILGLGHSTVQVRGVCTYGKMMMMVLLSNILSRLVHDDDRDFQPLGGSLGGLYIFSFYPAVTGGKVIPILAI